MNHDARPRKDGPFEVEEDPSQISPEIDAPQNPPKHSETRSSSSAFLSHFHDVVKELPQTSEAYPFSDEKGANLQTDVYGKPCLQVVYEAFFWVDMGVG